MVDLQDIIARLEKAEGPSRALDGRIAYALGWRFNGCEDGLDDPDFDEWDTFAGSWAKPGDRFIRVDETWNAEATERWPDPPYFTMSMDAAIEATGNIAPGWHWRVGTSHAHPKGWAYLYKGEHESWVNGNAFGNGANPSIALLITAFRAKARTEKGT